ncbi:MAG: hypothetical protein LRY71_02695 [Bacillaceae bacterium]|nr:hypothetical protein [Bacillaceae bacterium]
MSTRRHSIFNIMMIVFPWLTVLFIGKRHVKRYIFASTMISLFELVNHLVVRKRNWWKFYEKRQLFIRDELPFGLGPYIPLSMWILKYTYGNFKTFVLTNVVVNSIYAFAFVPFLKMVKIVRLHRINYFHFFFYIHYKAYLLYGLQYLFEKIGRIK